MVAVKYAKTDANINLQFSNRALKTLKPYLTSNADGARPKPLEDIAKGGNVKLAARSVTTFVRGVD